MLYRLKLEIGSNYDHPVATGRHMLRVAPLSIPGRQAVRAMDIGIEPEPESRIPFRPFFGGENIGFTIRHPHSTLLVRLHAEVEVTAMAWKTGASVPLAGLATALRGVHTVEPASPHHFLQPSPRLPAAGDDLAAYARESLKAGETAADIAADLMSRIHRDFVYDAKATAVDTSATEAFRLKRGVCQDFTHVMITGLRALGIPAGYVSGYLRTLPPAGRPRLVGADAMHAWVSAWVGPDCGWIEFDPTNDMLASSDHIVVGHGRDYSDIAPLAGTVKGHGGQDGFQRVDIAVAGETGA
jgi:transglutaminase-like putative cysteine protease